MKIKALSRSSEFYERPSTSDVSRTFTNTDRELHPMSRAVEYQRAVRATKLDRTFAKPFVCAMSDHTGAVTALCRPPASGTQGAAGVATALSGSSSGEVLLWDVGGRRVTRSYVGHKGEVTGVRIAPHGELAVSVGTDKTANLWRLTAPSLNEPGSATREATPLKTYVGDYALRSVDHHASKAMFLTTGARVEVWEHARSEPVTSFTWGAETINSVRFNPTEREVFVTTGSDRGIVLYDLRTSTPIRKLVMQTRTNAVAWNPMEAFNFTAASEDSNCYSYDMRKLGIATCIHRDHVSAVMDIDYSPVGREFVTGSYDRSVRLFAYNGGRSRDVYHTKRMQRVFSVAFTVDGSYVMSGSDDMNVRVWKANASEQTGVVLPRERKKAAYNSALLERYKHMPEVKRIARHRHVPKSIYKAAKLRVTMSDAERRKQKNREAHSAPGQIKRVPARKKKVIKEME